MPKITVMPSMALDAICYFEHRFLHDKTHPKQFEFITKINRLCGDKLGSEFISGSTLCLALTTFADNAHFDSMSLDELAQLFKDAEKFRSTVQSKVCDGFTASYLFPALDYLAEGLAATYAENIEIIKNAGFEKLWENDLFPLIQEKIHEKETVYREVKLDCISADIQKLKQCPPIGDVKIYVSALSYPVAFSLYGGKFLENIGGGEGVGMICHELMHGFATEKVTNLYLEYVKSDPYLAEKHGILTGEMQSGDEEEFVMAAEYYLRLKHNGESKRKLLTKIRYEYDDCTPVAFFLFDLLSRESETPNGYVKWLENIFENKKLPKVDAESCLNDLTRNGDSL
ncbi:MAG: hypothetical protein FWF77_04675 [Defluviitaleaceae bacterium]|nr:hypothetical protein [Defluviitaleaceae bacterium]